MNIDDFNPTTVDTIHMASTPVSGRGNGTPRCAPAIASAPINFDLPMFAVLAS